jgi:hypothetical protein
MLTLVVWLVADFEAISYQVTTTFDTGCNAQIRTAPAINYTACWHFVVIYLFQVFQVSVLNHLKSKYDFSNYAFLLLEKSLIPSQIYP